VFTRTRRRDPRFRIKFQVQCLASSVCYVTRAVRYSVWPILEDPEALLCCWSAVCSTQWQQKLTECPHIRYTGGSQTGEAAKLKKKQVRSPDFFVTSSVAVIKSKYRSKISAEEGSTCCICTPVECVMANKHTSPTELLKFNLCYFYFKTFK
jgi:hypothetical protein